MSDETNHMKLLNTMENTDCIWAKYHTYGLGHGMLWNVVSPNLVLTSDSLHTEVNRFLFIVSEWVGEWMFQTQLQSQCFHLRHQAMTCYQHDHTMSCYRHDQAMTCYQHDQAMTCYQHDQAMPCYRHDQAMTCYRHDPFRCCSLPRRQPAVVTT